MFAHGTLTATMQLAPPGQIGLAMGAWGAVQATAAGVGMAAGGLMRDGMALISTPVMGYSAVYAIEILLLGMTLWFSATAVTPLLVDQFQIAPSHVAWLTMAVHTSVCWLMLSVMGPGRTTSISLVSLPEPSEHTHWMRKSLSGTSGESASTRSL